MKNLDLNAMGVSEINEVEMLNVEGGNIFTAIGNAIASAAEAVADAAVWVWEHATGYNDGQTKGVSVTVNV